MKVRAWIYSVFLLFPVIAHADRVNWCKSIAEFSYQRLQNAHPPVYPDTFERKSHIQEDGQWLFDLPVSEVWKLYTQTPMSNAWASRLIVNRFTLPAGSTTPIDHAEGWLKKIRKDWPSDLFQNSSPMEWVPLAVGTRIYLDIRSAYIDSFCNMGIGFEVTNMIPNQVIQLEYLDFAPPYGKQWIYFDDLHNGKTRVRQVSQYQGKDWVIDKMYPLFHAEEIPRLHEQMQALSKHLR